MNKQLYLKQLRMHLRGLPRNEIDEIIEEYEDYFNEAMASGLTEDEVMEQLGTPQVIASNIKTNQNGEPAPSLTPQQSSPSQIIIIIALLFFNLTVVLGPALGIIGAFAGITFATSVFLITPIITLGGIIFGYSHLFEFFLSFVLAGVSLLLLPVWGKLWTYGMDLIRRYIDWNKRLVRGDAR